MIDKADSILKNIFGYDIFRPLQREIIHNVLSKKDSLVIMPTGGGKSLCYQIPALIFNGLTIVVSPLISLMKDQVEQLNEYGVHAIFLNSSLSPEDYRANEEKIRNNKVKLLYVAPETLSMEKTLNLLSSVKVDCLTIDEAHCISEWGHDFRPEYRQLAEIKLHFPEAVSVALTATATPRVQDDIIKNLHLNNSKKFLASFNRENLYIQVVRKVSPLEQTLDFLGKYPDQSGIIYCFSRRQVDDLYEELHYRRFSVLPYHAGLSDSERKRNQEQFIKDDVQIIVATIAFGMGINKPNVRFVIHHDLPKNMESYYQEIGRAGRDGLKAHCLLLFSYADIRKINYFIDQKEDKEKRIAKLHLDALVRYAETYECRRIPLLTYFGEKYSQDNCSMCDNCNAEAKDLTDVTIRAQQFLSCIKRTGEIFGAVHITDVLRGSKSNKVIAKNHDSLSTYGIGSDLSKEQWMSLSRQFIQKNLIEKDLEFGSLKVTGKGYEVLKSKRNVMCKLEAEEIKFTARAETDIDFDKNLFEILRSKRKEIADNSGIPPYVIFPDKTLIEMSAYFPQTNNELLKIHGVGKVKFNRYGKKFLKLITDYCRKNQISSITKTRKQRDNRITKAGKTRRYIVVAEAYQSGRQVEDILNEFNFKLGTFLSHLNRYVTEGNRVNTDVLLPLLEIDSGQQKIAMNLFDELGTDLLRPVYDELDGKVSYNDLQILRILAMNKEVLDKKE